MPKRKTEQRTKTIVALHGTVAELLSSQQSIQGCYGFAPPGYKVVVFGDMCLVMLFGMDCNRTSDIVSNAEYFIK